MSAAESDPAAALRARFRELTQQKEQLEQRIEQAAARLNAPGGAGTAAPLVDREGFPRSDVGDLAAAAADRRDLLCWTNDHKALMREIEGVLHALMGGGDGGRGAASAAAVGDRMEEDGNGATAAARPPPPPSSSAEQQQQQQPSSSSSSPLPPFASVGDVMPCSPASAAGMLVGDLVIRLAGVDASSSAAADSAPAPPPSSSSSSSSSSLLLQKVAAALQASENRPCAALVLREGRRVALELTPRPWAGRGLLGCHLRPLALPSLPVAGGGGGGGGAPGGNGSGGGGGA
jgi:26S proteasome regulatory subunit N4